jgi:hypothetical protein
MLNTPLRTAFKGKTLEISSLLNTAGYILTTAKHKLSIRAITPKLATEGEEFTVTYIVKNIGSTIFPGGNLLIQLTWPAIQGTIVTDPIAINTPLSLGSEFSSNKQKHTPLTAGYTFFTVINATATDGKPLEVCLPDGRQLWPTLVSNANQLFHAVRARTHEEISQRKAVWIAIISLAIIAVFQILDWLFRFLWKI